MTTKHKVIALHREHPDWSASDIASHLGCMREYVVATARRNDLLLPRASRNSNGGPALVHLTKSVTFALTDAADARGLTVPELARSIIETVAREDMVNAVLDDGGRA